MDKYHNNYFNIMVSFTDSWHFRCWSNWKRQPKLLENHQTSNDDIPSNEEGYKTLFSALSHIKESPSVMSAEFLMYAHMRNGNFNLPDTLPPKEDEISREFDIGNILGHKSQILKTKYDAKKYIITQQVVVWEALPAIWLSACIRGDTTENFDRACAQFKRLTYEK